MRRAVYVFVVSNEVLTEKCAEINSARRRGQWHRRGETVVEGHDDAVL